MGIQVQSNLSQPSINFNRVHLSSLCIEQPTYVDDNLQPKYKVLIEYQLFGVDVHMQRHYNPQVAQVELSDFIAEASAYASRGDMTLINALISIEAAVALLIQNSMDTEAEVT